MGRNNYSKTHPRMLSLAKSVGFRNQEKILIHAEVDAINKCRDLSKAYLIEVFVYSERSNSYRKSKPCPVCTEAILQSGIPYIRYRNYRSETITIRSSSIKVIKNV